MATGNERARLLPASFVSSDDYDEDDDEGQGTDSEGTSAASQPLLSGSGALRDSDDVVAGQSRALTVPSFRTRLTKRNPPRQFARIESSFNSSESNSFARRDATRAVSSASSAASKATSTLSHAHLLAGSSVAALTVGTGGLALAVAGAAFTGVSMGKGGTSLFRTVNHIAKLEKILKKGNLPCEALDYGEDRDTDHHYIEEVILPYIVQQKKRKAVKKGFDLAGLGLASGALRAGRAGWKTIWGDKGMRRDFFAHVLARHTVTCECELVEAIVSELYSADDYRTIRTLDSIAAADRIRKKIASVG